MSSLTNSSTVQPLRDLRDTDESIEDVLEHLDDMGKERSKWDTANNAFDIDVTQALQTIVAEEQLNVNQSRSQQSSFQSNLQADEASAAGAAGGVVESMNQGLEDFEKAAGGLSDDL